MLYLLLNNSKKSGYDSYLGKVIRAKSEKEARKIANEDTGAECKIWENSKIASCEKIKSVGTSKVILSDFYSV